MVEDQGMVVLGGLIQDEVTNNLNKVPLLGDIPLLGHLFTQSTVESRKANLMVFIRPTIVTSSLLSNKLAMDKYTFIRKKQLAQIEKGIRLLDGKRIPLLPEFTKGTLTKVNLPSPFQGIR